MKRKAKQLPSGNAGVIVESLAEQLVLLELTDMQALVALHSTFEELVKIGTELSDEQLESRATAAANLVEQIVMDTVDDRAQAVQQLTAMITNMQNAVCNGRGWQGDTAQDPTHVKNSALETQAPEPSPAQPESIETGQDSVIEDSAETPVAETTPEQPPQPAATSNSAISGNQELITDFLVEAADHLEASENGLLELETEPTDQEAINAVFRAYHTIKGVSSFLGLHEIERLSHQAENLLDAARRKDLLLHAGAIDVLLETTDALKRMLNHLRASLETGEAIKSEAEAVTTLVGRIKNVLEGKDAPPSKRRTASIDDVDDTPSEKIGDILLKEGILSSDELEDAIQHQQTDEQHRKLGQILVAEGKASPQDVTQALRKQQGSLNIRETVKVDAERLDQLLDAIGELVIVEAMVTQSDELRNHISADLNRQLAQLHKITRELQEMGLPLRMVPLKSTFQKMTRLVRDLSRKAGKKIDLVIKGEDTDLDKSVVEKIGDPLVHMIRNSVDHGIEATPEDRIAAGKPDTGIIELRAFHRGGNIFIEIEDDGRGLNRDRILSKAIERGLVEPDAKMSDEEIFELIFHAGFSTAEKITDVSGRGVGMDVVRRNIESLRGRIEVRSELGKGTVISIRLPITLAIIDGMVVRVGAERYIIPTLSVVRSIRPTQATLSTVLGKGEMLYVQDELIPMRRLSKMYDIRDAQSEATQALAIIVEDEGRRQAILVDELIGQQQIVIKSLGSMLKGLPGIAGGAIMADGRVGLIMDINSLMRTALETSVDPAAIEAALKESQRDSSDHMKEQ